MNFPATWDELLAMFACFALTACLFVMACAPHKVYAAALAAADAAARIIGA